MKTCCFIRGCKRDVMNKKKPKDSKKPKKVVVITGKIANGNTVMKCLSTFGMPPEALISMQ